MLVYLFVGGYLSFSGNTVVKNLPANAGDARDTGLIPGLRRSPGVGNGNPLQYSCLGNPMNRGAWWATVHGVAKSQTRLSICTHRLIKGLIYLSLPRLLFLSRISFLIAHKHSRKPKRKPLILFDPRLQACFLISITPSQNAFP